MKCSQAARRFENGHALLEEIGVEVGALVGDDVVLCQPGLDRLQKFHPHIGRIADDDVEAALREDFRKRRIPVERPRVGCLVMDEAVAGPDRVVELCNWCWRRAVFSQSERRVISTDSTLRSTP